MLSPAFNTYYTYGKFTPNIVHLAYPHQGKTYKVSEASVGIRYAYKEKIYAGPFTRLSLGSKYPIVEFKYTHGFQVEGGMLQSDFGYNQYRLSVSQQVNIPSLGKINYTLEGGITDGTLPILLLDVAKGNDTYYYNRYAFNNMNRYEFVSDHYASLLLEHHWGGFPFNRLPLLKKANWRTSCMTCHDPHGSPNAHLINFNPAIVGGARLFQDRGVNHGSCALTCHGRNHDGGPASTY